jgi:integrase/recombinase XerD
MKVQRIQAVRGGVTWILIDEEYRPVLAVVQYLRHLDNLSRSPNTIFNYANHLKLFWEFLKDRGWHWQSINLERLAEFITWLRWPSAAIPLHSVPAQRSESSINTILSAVYGFYAFQHRLGNVPELNAYGYQFRAGSTYKPFLHNISKSKPRRHRLLQLKEPKRILKTLTSEQVRQLIDASENLRDRFLICLLYETGVRIGQALGLRHGDIRSWDNEIDIVPRSDNLNRARAKRRDTLTIHVTTALMGAYTRYLLEVYPEDIDSDYVFINIWKGRIGQPMVARTVNKMLERLGKKVGVAVHPHMFRHTHGTELARAGVEATYIQKRLGHADVQTTINTYTHLGSDINPALFPTRS